MEFLLGAVWLAVDIWAVEHGAFLVSAAACTVQLRAGHLCDGTGL
ncbi:hypothetical protein [Geodermatophilus sp. DSM 44513]|nr:hypothetical protein [Geodermatophilus sp. DSM 44513]WNV76013.1 hypothetical protein RTG05_01760 [Geodermatophilus sp. DSM 44513]